MNALGSFPEVILAEVMDASKSELPVLGRLIAKQRAKRREEILHPDRLKSSFEL